jgi:hypothetical protein
MGLPTFTITLDPSQRASVEEKAQAAGFDLTEILNAGGGTLPEVEDVLLSCQVTAMAEGTTIVTFTVKSKPRLATVGMIQRFVERQMGIS